MKLVADLHIHSRFSRATSKDLDFAALHRGALEKGIGLVGTGDFTHPGWMAEIEEQLVPAEEGLFRLRPDLARQAEEGLPKACAGDVRFVLQVEISNIYKKDERTRKNHNLVFVPSLEAARRFTERLRAIGNVASDGRPILGLDARDLLEITLETDPLAFLVPAHIWTPWFSLFGSKSGFDHIDECFEDLTDEIFAVETGLSSDPPMNWRVRELDQMTIISDSDAHSAAKLGREANLLDIEPGYRPLYDALKHGQGFLGTIEFFPEEGKYHLDGHRKCDLRLTPEETRAHGGICPVCGGKLTVGVMSRVRDLAAPDRPEGYAPANRAPFDSLVPLAEVAGEVLDTGPSSKRVRGLVERLLAAIGPELHVLKDAPLDDIRRAGGPPLEEAIRRIRKGEMSIQAGYDGEFGVVKVFDAKERDRLLGQTDFIALPGFGERRAPARKKEPRRAPPKPAPRAADEAAAPADDPKTAAPAGDPLAGLNPDQRRVAETLQGPLLVVAGPGTGKTRTLVARIAHQVREGAVRPDQVLALTFTNQAREELEARLAADLPDTGAGRPMVTTFHGLGRYLLETAGTPASGDKAEQGALGIDLIEEEERIEIAQSILGRKARRREQEALLARVSLAKQSVEPRSLFSKDPEAAARFDRYEALLGEKGKIDIDDLVLRAYRYLCNTPAIAEALRERFRVVSVDEYQDINDVQAALVRQLSPDGGSLLAIGDPDQAIYGFRGAKPGHFKRFEQTFGGARTVSLGTSYRLTTPILRAAASVLWPSAPLNTVKNGPKVEAVTCPTADSEAEQILVRIERLIGGTSYFAVDSGRGGDAELGDVGFGDIAVLTRLKALHGPIRTALERSGVPCRQVAEDEPHDPRSDKVALMTMHASKGREFEVVFLAGVEPGLVPLSLEGLTSDTDEERRLLYVAITRAKRLVVISHAGRRTLFGQALDGGPSPFLVDLPSAAVTRTSPDLPKKKRDSQLSLF